MISDDNSAGPLRREQQVAGERGELVACHSERRRGQESKDMYGMQRQCPFLCESAADMSGDCTFPGGRLLVHVAPPGSVTTL